MAAYDKAVEDGEKHPAKKVSRMKGFYRCCVYKWKKSREREKCTLLCRACPRIAKKHRELPDVMRDFMGGCKKFKSRAPDKTDTEWTQILPPELTALVSEAVAPCRSIL